MEKPGEAQGECYFSPVGHTGHTILSEVPFFGLRAKL